MRQTGPRFRLLVPWGREYSCPIQQVSGGPATTPREQRSGVASSKSPRRCSILQSNVACPSGFLMGSGTLTMIADKATELRMSDSY